MSKTEDKPSQKTETTIIPPSYFQGHECHLPADKLSSFEIKCSKWRRFLFDLTTVRSDDIRARNMYKSYSALCAEKHRHYMNHPLSIHPFSKIRLWLEILFVFSIITSNTTLAIHYAEDPFEVDHHTVLMYITDAPCVLNIIANFLTGYVEGFTYKYVVLDLKKVFIKYVRTWFIIDLLSAVSFIQHRWTETTPSVVLAGMRIFRLPIVFFYLSNIMKAYKFGIMVRICTEISVYIFSYITWGIFFQFASEYIIEGSYMPKNPRECSWLTMGKLWNASTTIRTIYSLERSISLLRKNSNMTLGARESCLEVFYVISWCLAKVVIYHCALKFLIAMYGQESAASKYFTMTRQVEMYMNQQKLPPRIKKKILKFYAIRYQSCFFVEAPILSCVSGQLREDIIMHTGRQLVREMEVLKQLPRPLLLQLSLKLKLVIFIAGDIIYKINTIGDCFYFIDKGTVAVYSESGKEVCHLDDGDFFGEIALVMKHRTRTTSVVAVSNCELFRLDREEFNSSIACYPTVYEHFKKVAAHRRERTRVLDEHHVTEMRNVDRSRESLNI